MNFMTPHFRNLILIFKADTSSKLSCTTSGAAHPAVWRHRLTERGFPFTQHKCLCHTDINKIPRKNFIVASCSLGIKIRIKFRKWGVMKFIGHLDMMRYFQKAVRRAKIDIRYSEGYSPHQIMSFAAPLGVGITSDGEYFDIEVNESMTSKEAVAALNETMVDGVEVTSYVKMPDKAKTAMSIVAAADYRLSYKEGYESPFSTEEWKRIVKERFLDSPQFTIIKKTKKSEREVDLKPLVYAFSVEEEQGRPAFFLQVSTGSVDNIKPELVLSSVYQLCGLEYCESAIQIHRLEVYARDEQGQLVGLSGMGEEIV